VKLLMEQLVLLKRQIKNYSAYGRSRSCSCDGLAQSLGCSHSQQIVTVSREFTLMGAPRTVLAGGRNQYRTAAASGHRLATRFTKASTSASMCATKML
jgi:hypothetical protein